MPARTIYHTDEERREARKRDLAKYEASPKGQAARYRANHSPKADARYARYRETEGYAASQERYPRWLDVLWLCRRCHKAAHAVTATS